MSIMLRSLPLSHVCEKIYMLSYDLSFCSSLQRKDLVNYIQSHYKAPRIVLAGAGGVDHQKLCSLADKYLGNLSASYENAPSGVPEAPPSMFTGSEV